MADTLAVDLFINDARADAALKSFRAKAEAAGKAADNIGGNFAGKFSEQLKTAERKHIEFLRRARAAEKQNAAPIGGGGGVFGELLGGGIGGAIGAAFSGGALLAAANVSLEAAKDAENSLRLLKATAKETGIEFGVLREQAVAFGKDTALSNTEAQSTFAQIVNFANAAGRADKLEEFRKRFADLAAAKGINASQLGDISRQLNALTDEATDKLLNANPSAFYDKFARSIGKTAETLTDAEKRAAVFDAVLQKGAIFSGEAAKKMDSFAGRADSLTASLTNLKTAAGEAIKPLAEFILMGGQIDRKSFQSDAVAAEIARNVAIQAQQRAVSTANDLRTSDAEIAGAKQNPLSSLRNFALSRVNLATGFVDPVARKKAVDEAVKSAELYRDDLAKRLDKALGSGSSGLIGFAAKEFKQNINLFDLDTREKFLNGFSQATAAGFKEAIEVAKKNVPKLRSILRDIGNSSDLNSKDKNGLIGSLSKEIDELVTAGKARVVELERTINNLVSGVAQTRGSDNPFVKLFSDGEAAIENMRRSTRGLSKELADVIENQIKANNRKALLSARFDNALGATDLRADADRFRSANDNDMRRRIAAAEASGYFRNTDGLFRPEKTARERLDDQLATIDRVRRSANFGDAETARALADRKIIALTASLDPATLSKSQREEAAAAREREAKRLTDNEANAEKDRKETLELQKKISDSLADLAKKADKEGIEGIIRIVDETGGKVETRLGKRAGESDVKKYYEPQ